MNNQNLFSQSYDEIIKNVLGGGTNYFQMLGNPQSFNWPVAPVGQLSPEAYQLMSAAPTYSAVGEFGGVGESTLFSNYKEIFSHVGFKTSPQAAEQIKKLSDQATTAKNNATNAITNSNTAYNTAKQNGGVIFTTEYPTVKSWLEGPGSAYMKEIKVYTKESDEIFDQIQALNAANQPKTLQEAMNLIKLPSGAPSAGNPPRGWTVVKDQSGVLQWQPSFNISTDSQDWRQQLTNGSIGEKTISLSASKSDDSINKSWAGASTSVSSFFWGAYASGSWSKTDISESDDSVEATVSLKSATHVLVSPGAWYDGGFMKQLANAGNSGSGYQILEPYTTDGSHGLFGKDGLCSTMITGLVVAYKPSFSVTMKSSTYQKHEQEIKAAAGFRIGPFSFGGSGGHYSQNVSTTGNTTTLTGGSTSDDPVILGVTVGFPGTGKP